MATLPSVADQAERLVELGVPELAGISAEQLRTLAAGLDRASGHAGASGQVEAPGEASEQVEAAGHAGAPDSAAPADSGTESAALLAVHPSLVPTSRLAELTRREGKAGFVVVDMTDLADFTPTDDITLPDAPLYLVRDVTRGDDMLGWTPADAHPELLARGRTPLTVSEGVSWLLQQPEALEPGACFMCIGSRKRKTTGGFDARTPALWISGGTGRDGRENKGAPKLGWCWAKNHHTWLGFASTAGRRGPG